MAVTVIRWRTASLHSCAKDDKGDVTMPIDAARRHGRGGPMPRVALRGGVLEESAGQHRLPRDVRDRPYSVPHAMVGAEVQVRATVSVVEILHKGPRVIAHRPVG